MNRRQLAWCLTLFVRAGHSEENRLAAIRHVRAALAHGRDDATAPGLGGFVIAMVEYDRATAFQAFEQALALSCPPYASGAKGRKAA